MSYRRCTFPPFSSRQLCVMLSNSSRWSRWIIREDERCQRLLESSYKCLLFSNIFEEENARRKHDTYYTKKLKNLIWKYWYKMLRDKKNIIERLLVFEKSKISRLEFWIEIYYGRRCTSGLCRSGNVGRRQRCIRNAFSTCTTYDLRSHKFRITRGTDVFQKISKNYSSWRRGFYYFQHFSVLRVRSSQQT